MSEEQVRFTGLGYIEFDWFDEDDQVQKARWRRPNLKEYREFRNLLQEVSTDSQETRVRRNQLLVWLAHVEEDAKLPDDSEQVPEDFDTDAAWEEVHTIRDQLADYIEPWMIVVNKRLGKKDGLPDEIDHWPPWLLNPSLASDITVHWRNVPLAPGAKGTNSPTPSAS